jgi:hypothetical protein
MRRAHARLCVVCGPHAGSCFRVFQLNKDLIKIQVNQQCTGTALYSYHCRSLTAFECSESHMINILRSTVFVCTLDVTEKFELVETTLLHSGIVIFTKSSWLLL